MATRTQTPKFINFPLAPDWFEVFEDFDNEYTTAFVVGSSPWISTALSSGTVVQTTDERFGLAIMSGAGTTDNSGSQIQQDMEVWDCALGGVVEWMGRWKCSDGTQDEVFSGLAITDTTLIDGTGTLSGGLTHTDSIGFYKPDGDTVVYGVARTGSVQLATAAYSITGTSYNTYGFRVTMDPSTAAKGRIEYFINGIQVGTLDSTTITAEQMAMSHAFNTGDATGTKTNSIDYLGCRQLRA